MTLTRYKSIRGESDFLARYFIIEGGANVNPQIFNQSIAMWIQNMGIDVRTGIEDIVHFLDIKHNFCKIIVP